jgi:hypothetical protein
VQDSGSTRERLCSSGSVGHQTYGASRVSSPSHRSRSDEHLVSPIDGSHCCGIHDCAELSSQDVEEKPTGYYIKALNELVPFREVQTSRDGQYWRCKRPDGSRRCFFAPPPSI